MTQPHLLDEIFEKGVPASESSVQKIAADMLLGKNDLTLQSAHALVDYARKGVDFSELYLEHQASLSLSLDQSIVRSCRQSQARGGAIRTIRGEQTGYAYTESLNESSLRHAARSASTIRNFASQSILFPLQKNPAPRIMYAPINPLIEGQISGWVDLLNAIDQKARKASQVCEVQANIALAYKAVGIVASDGTEVFDYRPMVSLMVRITVKKESRKESARGVMGGRFSPKEFTQARIDSIIDETTERAIKKLDAKEAPAGDFPIVLANGWAGVLIHEAVGHGLEGDGVRKGHSAFCGFEGKKVASEHCTIVDSGLMPHRRGSLSIDDEGTPTQENTLIENGKLVGFLWDKHNALLADTKTTGSGRRESYASPPLPRMRNTFLKGGDVAPEDLIKPIKKGIYAQEFGGGQVDTTSGQFVFNVNEAYLIEDGKITAPIKGASIIGDCLKVLQNISGVGNDFRMDDGMGTCGKDGQWVPVGVGQPSVRIDSITVGGSALEG